MLCWQHSLNGAMEVWRGRGGGEEGKREALERKLSNGRVFRIVVVYKMGLSPATDFGPLRIAPGVSASS